MKNGTKQVGKKTEQMENETFENRTGEVVFSKGQSFENVRYFKLVVQLHSSIVTQRLS